MKISDIQKRLQAPFPPDRLEYKRNLFQHRIVIPTPTRDLVVTRLDNVCPDWTFSLLPDHAGGLIGTLTLLNVFRCARGIDPDDILIQAAELFGVGAYLRDLPRLEADEGQTPTLPAWAIPDHERLPGHAHLIQAMEQLKHELPDDLGIQREVYKHLTAALKVTGEQQ